MEGEGSCGVCAACRVHRVGPVELLEKYWFFHNTLDGVGVSNSSIEDSCSKNSREMVVKDSNEPTAVSEVGFSNPNESLPLTSCVTRQTVCKIPNDGSIFPSSVTTPREHRFHNSKLLRAPSLPPDIGRNEAGRGEDRRRKPREARLQRDDGSVPSSIAPSEGENHFLNHKLLRAPSLPPDNAAQGGESRREPRQTRLQQNKGSLSTSVTPPKEESHLPRSNLLRAPSLPPAKVKNEEEAQEEESRRKSRVSRLQRSVSSLEIRSSFTPRRYRGNSSQSSKVANIPRDRQPTETNRQKSLSELEIEELQGFMDLGFTFNREDISPTILNMIPGLQENRPIDEERVRRPYLSEAWSVQRSVPPRLNRAQLSSRVEMKEQLKVWARTVASDVGQKC
ncbi:uncharacterized protein [Aristolochia californica]|uniref:uncharacterized protein n=1 Tax=Aristolochia californica TaxID=171875 RepID=UPI0035DB3E3D